MKCVELPLNQQCCETLSSKLNCATSENQMDDWRWTRLPPKPNVQVNTFHARNWILTHHQSPKDQVNERCPRQRNWTLPNDVVELYRITPVGDRVSIYYTRSIQNWEPMMHFSKACSPQCEINTWWMVSEVMTAPTYVILSHEEKWKFARKEQYK